MKAWTSVARTSDQVGAQPMSTEALAKVDARCLSATTRRAGI